MRLKPKWKRMPKEQRSALDLRMRGKTVLEKGATHLWGAAMLVVHDWLSIDPKVKGKLAHVQ